MIRPVALALTRWIMGMALVLSGAWGLSCSKSASPASTDPRTDISAAPPTASAPRLVDAEPTRNAEPDLREAPDDADDAPAMPTLSGRHHRASSALNRFSIDLFRRVRAESPNLISSPASAWIVLAMAMAGSSGATEAEMKKALHLGDLTEPDDVLAALLSHWHRSDGHEGVVLRIEQRLWPRDTSPVLPEFDALMRQNYRAPVERLDFKARETAAARINSWASDATRGRISWIVLPDDFNETLRLVLTNAIYFKGAWETPFRPQATQQEDFSGPSGVTRVELMHRRGMIPFRRVPGGKIVSLAYRGMLSMLVALPDDRNGLPTFEAQFAVHHEAWSTHLTPCDVDLKLPRWKAESTLELRSALTDMGMARAFTDDAEFPRIMRARLSIAFVRQRAFIEVGEAGTEAAAVTAGGMALASLRNEPPPPPPMPFYADHPFLFAIRDATTGALLFVGRVEDPSRP